MKVEIWSDVMCPFCYIGKRKFEKALEQFEHKNEVIIEWKSFQLNPDMKTDAGKSINEYLAEIKGWTLERAKEVNAHVTGMAKEVGLNYNFDKAIVANSFDAHRLIQLAKQHNKGDMAEEHLFKAYFTDGKNIADHTVLTELGLQIGLSSDEIKKVLESDMFTDKVNKDIYEASQIGVRGVPFFVIDRKYAVSGAQNPETFLTALTNTWQQKAV
jgi:predicted DsbA family dithiol-disulfide isomerase